MTIGDTSQVQGEKEDQYVPMEPPGSIKEYQDLLGELYLYVSWKQMTRRLTTRQKELWADAVEQWQPDPEHPEDHDRDLRWWT